MAPQVIILTTSSVLCWLCVFILRGVACRFRSHLTDPIKLIVIRVALTEKKLSEKSLQVIIIGAIIKSETSYMLKVRAELGCALEK